jgi:dihydroorotate dehydrogenase electron transfer subunit
MQNDKFVLKSDLPNMVKIIDIIDEAPGFKTFLFSIPLTCKPGQFLMIWLPRIDEKPFTLSYQQGDVLGITVQCKGKFTEALFQLQVGDCIGVRGGYGNGYQIKDGETSCVITGGSGTATVLPLANALRSPNVIIGAQTKESLLFKEKLPGAIFATDDGSYGFHGNVVEAFIDLLQKKQIDTVYACGPEKMLAAIIEICKQKEIKCQFAMERYMKCGIGVCGTCTCGKKRVCVDGPIFNLEDMENLTEFAKLFRTKSGKPQLY